MSLLSYISLYKMLRVSIVMITAAVVVLAVASQHHICCNIVETDISIATGSLKTLFGGFYPLAWEIVI